ncbi:MAG: LuxR C-terminal-related transcriptional regulator [Cellulomonas sp.]
MAAPLIATKLHIPQVRRGLVARPRLLERLRRGADSQLTLVSAPAGFGKTTLLTEWLDETSAAERRVAWLSLDAADNAPVTFWTYVVTAFQGAVPGVGANALELLLTTPLPTELVLTTLLNDLAAAPGEVWLVLDDYHLVDHHDVGQGMAFLLQHLPPQVHVVLSTRADPDLPLARWRVRGELVELRAADLRFTSDEAAAYLNEATGLRLTAGDVEALEERTEGWIAALQLAALSLQGRDDVSGFIARFAGNDRYLVDYLVEEVLTHQSQPVRDFLLRSAVLDRLTGPLCDAVVGRAGSSELLATLDRANLFLVTLDDQRTWYRYHHLFADVLRARLLAEQPALVPLLHQRASNWYEEHDSAEEAVRHALAGRDLDRAVHLMELAVPAIRRNRQEAVLLAWLRLLPDDVVRLSPVLNVFYGWMLLVSGDADGFELRLDDAERALAAVSDGAAPPWADTVELRTLPATIAVYRASLAQARGDVAGTEAHAQRALGLAGPDDHLARGSAAGFLGMVAWARGDVSIALETFAQAVASLHAAGNLVDELSSTVVLADMWLAAGRPRTARRLCERALRLADEHGERAGRATVDLLVGLSELDYELGDLAAAKERLERAAALGEGASMTESRHRWFSARARVAAAEGDLAEAVALLDEAEARYLPGFVPATRPLAAMKARIWIAHSHVPEAARWARERGVATTDDAAYLSEFDHLTLVRLLLAQHRAHPDPGAIDQAVRLLARLREAAEASGRAGSLVEIQLLTALAQDAQGHRQQARQSLADARDRSPEPDGYVRLFLDEGTPLAELTGEPTSSAANAWGEPLSERELQVLRLLDSELTGPQIARELFVTLNTLRSHTKRIFTKLEVTSRRAAVSRARERGLL